MDFPLQTKSCPAWVEANNNAVGYYHVDYRNGLLPALAKGDVEHRLEAAERVDFMGNAAALSSGGKLQAGEALGLVETFHNDPERYVVESALDLALAPELHLVPPDLDANYQRFLLKNFQARAHEIGWTPKPGEPDNVRLLRPYLLNTVATSGGDRELARQARDLTEAWFKSHAAIDLNITSAVLRTAAYYGDKALLEKFLDSLQTTNDRQERQRIFAALASFRDPAAIQAGMNATLSGKVPFIEGLRLLFAGQESASTRNMAFDFMKAHFDEISRKRPTGGGFDAGAEFPYVGADFCSAESKQQLDSFFAPRIANFTGGPRVLSQVLESIDLCIAEKQAQEPSVSAFLKNY
jgi:alanyl aminopeptidase